MSRKELKEEAKKSLKGKYGQYIILVIVYSLLTSGVVGVLTLVFELLKVNRAISSPIVAIISVITSALLTLGEVSFSLKVARNKEVKWTELFSKTSLWLTFIIASLLVGIFTTLWTLLLIIPGIIAVFKYSMVNYILVDEPEIGALEAISKSKEMMDGHKLDLFILRLSFIGWILLGLLTFGILYIWLVPYMNVTTVKFYDSIKK